MMVSFLPSSQSYFEQAPLVAGLLSIKLANRTWGGRPVPMAGFPLQQLEKYLKILVEDQRKLVAICEEFRPDEEGVQRASPQDWKTINQGRFLNEKVEIVRRVTRVVSPGTLIDERWMNPLKHNYILSLTVNPDCQPSYGLAWLDLSTSDLHITHCLDIESVRDEVKRISPSEIVLDSSAEERLRFSSSSSNDSGGLQSNHELLLRAIDVGRTLVTSLTVSPSTTASESVVDAAEGEATQTYHNVERTAILNLTAHLRSRLLDIGKEKGADSDDVDLEKLIASGLARHHVPEDFMAIDSNTLDALEVRETNREGGVRGSMVSTVRRTMTKGGSRLLIDWLTAPSTSHAVITDRHSIVGYFVDRPFFHEDLRTLLRQIQRGDISRTLQRISTARNDEQDLLEIRDFVNFTAELRSAVAKEVEARGTEFGQSHPEQAVGLTALSGLVEGLTDLTVLGQELGNAIDERVMERRMRSMEAMDREDGQLEDLEDGGDSVSESKPAETAGTASEQLSPSMTAKTSKTAQEDQAWGPPFEHLIRPGSAVALTNLTREYERLRQEAAQLQAHLRSRYSPSGSATNRVTLRFLLGQGFVVHFSNYRKIAPSDGDEGVEDAEQASDLTMAYRSKSTRTFYHEPWSNIGARLLRLQEELKRAENFELRRLRNLVVSAGSQLRSDARRIDELDCLMGFAQLAGDMRLVRPEMVNPAHDEDACVFDIVEGRHIGVEDGLLDKGRSFTPNDLAMGQASRLHFITGPNMGGKSTFLRQNALICILAQAGCFIPATSGRLSIVDRLFSRVGAKDDLFRDRSTFMVEMLETAEILRRATRRSFVVADEIGRGTTTQVGIAIAFATLQEIGRIGCRALFASHLHELADMMGYQDIPGQTSPTTVAENFQHVRFASTDIEDEENAITYLHHIRPGVNRESHGLTVAALAGMPKSALEVAHQTLDTLRTQSAVSERR